MVITDLVWATIAFRDAGSPASATISGGVSRRADRVAHGGELVLAASGHRPFQAAVALVMRGEIFGDELAGKTGGAIDDDVEFRRRHRLVSLRSGFLVIASEAKQSSFARKEKISWIASSQVLLAMTVELISWRRTRPCRRAHRPGCHRARSDSAGRSWPVASCP